MPSIVGFGLKSLIRVLDCIVWTNVFILWFEFRGFWVRDLKFRLQKLGFYFRLWIKVWVNVLILNLG
jgi:hypothetical protein